MEDFSRFRFGRFEFDPGTFRLLRDGTPVPVEPKALDLLRVLLERAPRVVDKTEIFSRVWKDVAVTDNALTRLIAQLRKSLEDDPKAPRYIETVATRGYRFVADVAVIPWAAADRPVIPGGLSPPALAGAPSTAQSHSRSTRFAPAALAGVVLLTTAAWIGSRFVLSAPALPGSPPNGNGAPDVEAFAALRPQQLTTGNGFDGYLAFAPDGKSIAFSSDRSGALEIYVQGVAPGSTALALTSNGRHNVQPVWSPDGQFLAYHEMAGNGIWIVPSRGGVPRRISDFGAHPAWSPDGARVAFQSLPVNDINPLGRPGALSTIWVVDSSGRGQPTAVTAPGEPAGPHLAPVWWADSKRVLFAVPSGKTSGYGTSLWSADVDARQLRHIRTHESLSPEFTLAPDGRGVYFMALATKTIWWLPLTASGDSPGDPQPTGIPAGGPTIAHLTISSDGRRVAWTALDSNSHVWAADIGRIDRRASRGAVALTEGIGMRYSLPAPSSDGRLALVGSRSGSNTSLFLLAPRAPLRQLTTDPPHHGGPLWMPGEREIAFVTNHGEGPGFWAVDPETGRERMLFLLSELPQPPAGSTDSTAAPFLNIAIARDFTRLVMAVVRDGAPNLWVASLRESRPDGALVQRTFESEGGTYPVWSPDGRWIAYQCASGTDTHVCVTGADDDDRIQLTNEPGQSWIGGWSPDSDRIVFAARRGAVWNVATVSRSTSVVRTLTSFTEPRLYVRYPRWDRAHNRIIFERSETTGRIWSVDLPSPL